MALYELSTEKIAPLELAKFASLGLFERKDLPAPSSRSHRSDSTGRSRHPRKIYKLTQNDRRIDLLAVDEQARLIVIE